MQHLPSLPSVSVPTHPLHVTSNLFHNPIHRAITTHLFYGPAMLAGWESMSQSSFPTYFLGHLCQHPLFPAPTHSLSSPTPWPPGTCLSGHLEGLFFILPPDHHAAKSPSSEAQSLPVGESSQTLLGGSPLLFVSTGLCTCF